MQSPLLHNTKQYVAFFLFLKPFLFSSTEMAGHYKRGEVPPKDPAPQQYRIQRLLPPWAHSMGKSPVCMHRTGRLSGSALCKGVFSWLYLSFPAGDGVLPRLSLRSAGRWAGVFLLCVSNRFDPSTRDEIKDWLWKKAGHWCGSCFNRFNCFSSFSS